MLNILNFISEFSQNGGLLAQVFFILNKTFPTRRFSHNFSTAQNFWRGIAPNP